MFDPNRVRKWLVGVDVRSQIRMFLHDCLACLSTKALAKKEKSSRGFGPHFTIISARTLQDLRATSPTLQGIVNTLNTHKVLSDAFSAFHLMKFWLLDRLAQLSILTLETEYSAKFFNLLCGHCNALDAGAEVLKKATATATKEFRDGSALLGEAEGEDIEEEDIDTGTSHDADFSFFS